jgi:hypothetical protein
MVTLLGFFFILANVGLLELFMPDLVGPVSVFTKRMLGFAMAKGHCHRVLHGCTTVLHLDYGCAAPYFAALAGRRFCSLD